ncbi:PREDICTED: uncharacterized protein LOC109326700 [Lupinus angustifolius]|uniref:uncharacterized protein LOC109326700 n=1 Tax=Lupinus angustifolius TaxID=3871 RepID=UPI00092F33A1|nr:PREDICTED: uncharacterized protein LOC109326700 [Lupinus angustifolius]
MILSWLLNSLSTDHQPRVVGCKHSFQLWREINEYCNAQTKAKSRQLRAQLKSMVKGSSSISEYFMKIKVIVDSLLSIGSPITLAEHTDCILDGLPEEYQTLITTVESQEDTPSINALQSYLLTFEARLERNRSRSVSDALSVNIVAASPPSPVSINSQMHTYSIRSPISPSRERNDELNPPNFHGNSRYRSNFRGNRGRRGGYGSRSNSRPRGNTVYCEYCNKYGHEVSYCYYAPSAYGSYYYGTPTPRHQSNFTPRAPRGFHHYLELYFSHSRGSYGHYDRFAPNSYFGPSHQVTQGPSGPHAYPPNQGHFGSHYAMTASASGATNHLTADPGLVQEPAEKFTSDQIYLGNGSSIAISTCGNSKFNSPFNPHVSLSLRNLFLVPSITKNLLSVSQFAQDNNCYFEFHPCACFVKSQATDQVLLRGTLTPEGLYAFHDLLPFSYIFSAAT